jgi:hypothetical protein
MQVEENSQGLTRKNFINALGLSESALTTLAPLFPDEESEELADGDFEKAPFVLLSTGTDK